MQGRGSARIAAREPLVLGEVLGERAVGRVAGEVAEGEPPDAQEFLGGVFHVGSVIPPKGDEGNTCCPSGSMRSFGYARPSERPAAGGAPGGVRAFRRAEEQRVALMIPGGNSVILLILLRKVR